MSSTAEKLLEQERQDHMMLDQRYHELKEELEKERKKKAPPK